MTRRIHGGIFPRMPVIRLDPAEESVSSCEFLTRYERATSYDVQYIWNMGIGTCIPYTQIVQRSCLITGIVVARDRCREEAPRRFSGKSQEKTQEPHRALLPVSTSASSLPPSSCSSTGKQRIEGERETLIFIVPYAGRPAKTPGDSQS